MRGPKYFLCIVLVSFLCSCSIDSFQVRKNFQPRVKITSNYDRNSGKVDQVVVHPKIFNQESVVAIPNHQDIQVLPTETVGKTNIENRVHLNKRQYPLVKKKTVQKKEVKKTKTVKDDSVVGLIVNLIAFILALASIFMIFGMIAGNVWVYFIIGMVLDVAAIIMAVVGRMLPWRGFSTAAMVIAILMIITLLVLLVLITVLSIL